MKTLNQILLDERACNTCNGDKMILEKIRDLGGYNPDSIKREITITCPVCNGQGHTTEKTREAYYNNWKLA